MIAWRLIHKLGTTRNHESTDEGVDTGLKKASYQALQFWVWETLVSTFTLDSAIFLNLPLVRVRLCATVDCQCQRWCHIHAVQLPYVSPLSSKWNDDISEVHTQKGFNEAENPKKRHYRGGSEGKINRKQYKPSRLPCSSWSCFCHQMIQLWLVTNVVSSCKDKKRCHHHASA